MSTLKEKLQNIFNNRLFLGVTALLILAGISAFLVATFFGSSQRQVNINVAEPGDACYLQFSVAGTEPIEGFSCTKEFRDVNNILLQDGYRPKPLEKLILTTKVINTGNTVLSNLTLDDPLNATFASEGAKNLEFLKFELLKTTTGTCNFDESTKLLRCSNLNLAVGQTLEISFQVELLPTVGSSKEITNVSKVYTPSKLAYCLDSITTSPITNVCNYTSGYCEQVFRDKEGNETVCTSDVECKPDTPTHLECVSESCKAVAGAGENKCSSDKDCRTPTHSICKDRQCQEVEGKGDSECSKDSECVYKKCVDNSCTLDTCEDGDCDDECDTSADCRPQVTTTPQPVVSVSPAVPQTGSNDNNIILSMFLLAWVGSGAFFIAKAGILKR